MRHGGTRGGDGETRRHAGRRRSHTEARGEETVTHGGTRGGDGETRRHAGRRRSHTEARGEETVRHRGTKLRGTAN